MNRQREAIRRIKKGEPHLIYFPDNGDIYRQGMSGKKEIVYHLAVLESIAGNGISQLLGISHMLEMLVQRLQALKDSYSAVAEAEQIINPEE